MKRESGIFHFSLPIRCQGQYVENIGCSIGPDCSIFKSCIYSVTPIVTPFYCGILYLKYCCENSKMIYIIRKHSRWPAPEGVCVLKYIGPKAEIKMVKYLMRSIIALSFKLKRRLFWASKYVRQIPFAHTSAQSPNSWYIYLGELKR